MISDVQVALAAARAEYVAAEQAEIDARRRGRVPGLGEVVARHVRALAVYRFWTDVSRHRSHVAPSKLAQNVAASARARTLRVRKELSGCAVCYDDPAILLAVDEALARAVEQFSSITERETP